MNSEIPNDLLSDFKRYLADPEVVSLAMKLMGTKPQLLTAALLVATARRIGKLEKEIERCRPKSREEA